MAAPAGVPPRQTPWRNEKVAQRRGSAPRCILLAYCLPSQHPEHRDELVVVSEVAELGQEYRCFCRKAKVFCHSSYPQEPYRSAPPEVRSFAEDAARRLLELSPRLRMVTIDVAVSERDGRMRLVEAGGVNSWGVYGADVKAFIAAMEAEARWRGEGEPLDDEAA